MKIWNTKAKRMSPAFLMILTFPASSIWSETVSSVWAGMLDGEMINNDVTLPINEIRPIATIMILSAPQAGTQGLPSVREKTNVVMFSPVSFSYTPT